MTTETVRSLTCRRETFLSRPEWVEEPWKLIAKSPLEELFDLFLRIPAILQQLDGLSRETNKTVLQNGFCDMMEKCSKTEGALRGLYSNFERSASGPLYWPEFSTLDSRLDDTTSGKVFPISFHFPSFSIAQVVTTYWMGMMMVHYLLRLACDRLAAIDSLTDLARDTNTVMWPTSGDKIPPPVVLSSSKSREHDNKWKTMVRNICQSLEYHLQDRMGGLGPVFILTQLLGCKKCLENDREDFSREISWITEFTERIRKRLNFPVDNLFEG